MNMRGCVRLYEVSGQEQRCSEVSTSLYLALYFPLDYSNIVTAETPAYLQTAQHHGHTAVSYQ